MAPVTTNLATIGDELIKELSKILRVRTPSEIELRRIRRAVDSLRSKSPEDYFLVYIACAAAEGDFEGAKELFESCKRQGAMTSDLWVNYGISLRYLGETLELKTHFDAGLTRYADDPEFLEHVVDLCVECGLYETSRRALLRRQLLGKDNPGLLSKISSATEILHEAGFSESDSAQCAGLVYKELAKLQIHQMETTLIVLEATEDREFRSIVVRYGLRRSITEVVEAQDAVAEALAAASLPVEEAGIWVPLLTTGTLEPALAIEES